MQQNKYKTRKGMPFKIQTMHLYQTKHFLFSGSAGSVFFFQNKHFYPNIEENWQAILDKELQNWEHYKL